MKLNDNTSSGLWTKKVSHSICIVKIVTRTSAYQGIKNVGFLESFAYVLNDWSFTLKLACLRFWEISCILNGLIEETATLAYVPSLYQWSSPKYIATRMDGCAEASTATPNQPQVKKGKEKHQQDKKEIVFHLAYYKIVWQCTSNLCNIVGFCKEKKW